MDREVWCVDCGHHISLHNSFCTYWTGLCDCKGFVSRSEALAAIAGRDRVKKAVQDAGINPGYHRTVKDRVEILWPSLMDAVQDLIKGHSTR